MNKLTHQNIPLYYIILILLIVLVSQVQVHAEDLRSVKSLNGQWKFSIGDDLQWKETNYNDSDWDRVWVPGKWEDNGYSEYNGYAWYRKEFHFSEYSQNAPTYLVLDRVDDVDEVYLNGKLLGSTGYFPPEYLSSWNTNRKYIIPEGFLNTNGKNQLAVRIYDDHNDGGIIGRTCGIFVDEDYQFLDFNLSGEWKFHKGDNKAWKSPSFNDTAWDKITVPVPWEKQGYAFYDGYGWYRTEFELPVHLVDEELFLILGKVDDYDYVYLNGQSLGKVFDLERNREYRGRGSEWKARRAYEIPADMLNKSGNNHLAVRVYDKGEQGGIYEGPVGIATRCNHNKYMNRHYVNANPVEIFFNALFDELY